MDVVCDDGDKFNLDYIDLRVIQSGTEEATLESIEPGSLIRLKLVVRFAEQAAKLTFTFGLPGDSYSCTQLLQVTEFQNCFSKPFNFKLLSKETGLVVFSQRSEQRIFSAPPKFHLEMYRVLDRLQQKSKQLIMIPRRVLTDEEIKNINELLHIVRHGRIQGTWTEFSVKLMNFSEDAFNQLSTDPFWFRLEAQEEMTIFGVKLPLGVSEQLFRNGLFANLDEIRKAYQSGKRDIFAHVVAKDGSGECEKIYHDFAKKVDNEHTFEAG